LQAIHYLCFYNNPWFSFMQPLMASHLFRWQHQWSRMGWSLFLFHFISLEATKLISNCSRSWCWSLLYQWAQERACTKAKKPFAGIFAGLVRPHVHNYLCLFTKCSQVWITVHECLFLIKWRKAVSSPW
jgi:hypothetical protein